VSFELHGLARPKAANRKRKRVGRGPGSGNGVTAGRGDKGQKSRSGYSQRFGFEGGQMPLQRRLPKFGFTNIHRKLCQVVNVEALEKIEKKDEINSEILFKSGLISKKHVPVKILGKGDLKSRVNVEVHAISKSAKEKIEKLGGKVTLL